MNGSHRDAFTEEMTSLLMPDQHHHQQHLTGDHVEVNLDPPTPSILNSDPASPGPESAGHPCSALADKIRSPQTEMSHPEVEFRVGKDRQLMIGSTSQLASISPVFRAMFGHAGVKEKRQTIVEIPDVNTQSFGVILRSAARDNAVPLTEDTVWNVLRAADQFQVLPIVTRCFHFLLRKHSQRHKSHHLCAVMEKAHQLNYREHHAKCLHRIKRQAHKVFRSGAALSVLCHQCMLELVMAEDLPVPETLVHDAVVTWARVTCSKNAGGADPGWEELRATAGQLVYHVRYLAMPRSVLQSLPAGQAGCLLSEKEKACLLEGQAASFPQRVASPRQKTGLHKDRLHTLCLRCMGSKKPFFLAIFSILVLLTVFLVVYLYSSELFESSSSKPDAPIYILMIQEDRQ